MNTHGETHHAAVVDALGRQLVDREFPTTPRGYRASLAWLISFGALVRVVVEGHRRLRSGAEQIPACRSWRSTGQTAKPAGARVSPTRLMPTLRRSRPRRAEPQGSRKYLPFPLSVATEIGQLLFVGRFMDFVEEVG